MEEGFTGSLTTGADSIIGTTGADTINTYIDAAGTTDTFTAPDSISGGDGTDTINITTDGNGAGALPAATVSGIEVWSIREVGGTAGVYDFGTVAGETSVINAKSTDDVTFSNVAAGSSITIKGDTSTTNGATTFTMASATDAVTLNIDGGTTAGNVTRNATGAATITVNSTGAANTIGTLDVDTATAVKGLTINATTDLTASLAADFAASSKLTVTGAGKVTLTGAALSASITEVDASAQTAGGTLVKVDQTNTTVDTKFTGGAGNDTLDVGKVVYDSTTITGVGGDGTDTLKMSDAAALTSTTVKYLTGFEILSLYDDNDGALDTFDASLMSATGVTLAADSAGDGYSITNMSSTAAANVKITGTQAVAPTFGVKNASVVGNLDTMAITIDDLAKASVAATTITLADLTVAGVETFNFTLTDNLTVTAATGMAALTKATFTGAGDLSFTTGALALNVNTVIDASAATGAVTIDGTNGTANGLAITGTSSSKVNTLTGTAQADTITAGAGDDILKGLAGNDSITAGAGNDTITGGAGNDTIDVGSGLEIVKYATVDGETQVGVVASGFTVTGDVITGMGNGDKLDLSTGGGTAGGTFADGAIAVGTTFSAGVANEMKLISGSYDATTKVFTAGAASTTNNDYVFQYNGGATATTVNTIVMVDIVGTLTATSASEIITLTVA